MELPLKFKERMLKLLGDEFALYEQSFYSSRMYGLRVNTKKIPAKEFEKISPFSIRRIPWIENGYYYDGSKDAPAKHPYYHAGLYYLQEPSAMTPANLLPIAPGDHVLDLCAAPGGKATELGARLNGSGLLVANDISNSRAKGLLKNLELFGIDNMMVTNEIPDKLLSNFENFFDKILIDAPCSGEGMFRKDPAIMKSWIKKGPEEFSIIQREIISTAVKMLKPGGMMLYSTCTFSPEENEGTIAYLLKSNDDMELLPAGTYEGFSEGKPEWLEHDSGPDELRNCIRIWPHKMDGEGHFIALLHKKGRQIPDSPSREYRKKASDNEYFKEFTEMISYPMDPERIAMYMDRLYYMPQGSERGSGLHFLRNGLLLGECKKNRFEPSQAFAMALSSQQCKNKISFSCKDPRVIKYLKGETLEVEDLTGENAGGWYLVCVDGYPLGWGKLTKGTLKNKYHAGWRWM